MGKQGMRIAVIATVSTAVLGLSACSESAGQNSATSPAASAPVASSSVASPPAASPSGSTPVVGSLSTSVHSNDVVFNYGDGVRAIRFGFSGSYSITPGQPWQGVTQFEPTNTLVTVIATAGRKNSAVPAKYFTSMVTQALSTSGGPAAKRPDELNFAFYGTLFINEQPYNITLGQGSTATANNWWIGGDKWLRNQELRTPDGKYTITAKNTNSWLVRAS